MVVVSVIMALGSQLGLSSLYPTQSKNPGFEQYSVELAKEEVKRISKKLHAVQQEEELAEVCSYLMTRLIELGFNTEI